MIGLLASYHLQHRFKIANEKDLLSTEYFRSGLATQNIPLDDLSSPREGGGITFYNDHAQLPWSNFPFQTLREEQQQLSPSSSTSMTFSRPSANRSRMDLETSSQRTSELSSTPSSSATTFSLSVRYSHDEQMEDADDDVAPKIEEMDEDGMEDTKVIPTSESPKAAQAKTEGPPTGARKRGRPRKHPCPPSDSQATIAKSRSKTGCTTCRRRKKKCDETKPSCKRTLISSPIRRPIQSFPERRNRSGAGTADVG